MVNAESNLRRSTSLNLALSSSRLPADAIDPGRASDEQAADGQGGRGQAPVVLGQLVRVQQFKPVARPHHEGDAILVQAEDPANTWSPHTIVFRLIQLPIFG